MALFEYEYSAEDILKLLDIVPLKKSELRRCLRPAAQVFFNNLQQTIGKGWGVRTGRMSREGVKMGVSSRDERGPNNAAYRIYFSKSRGTRGTSDYIAPTYVARWLEGGTEPHYTSKGATIKKGKRGKLALNAHQRKLRHPGFAGRPIVEATQSREKEKIEQIVRNNIMAILRKKGVQNA